MTEPTGLAPHLASAAATAEVAGVPVARHYGDPAAEFAAAHAGVVVVARQHEGRLRAVGRDRLDLLHRMSTNDLNHLPPGQARETVLTTPIARIIDRLWVLNRGELALALTSPGRALAVRRWLAGYIFYKDEVKLEDASAELGQLALLGPQATQVAEALVPGAGALAENHFVEQGGVLALRGRPLAGDGLHLIAPAGELPALWQAALAAGAAPAGEAAYELLRLEAGQPAAGHELTEDYIPLEANLWPAVSFTKGCYIGQEIIARMESRGKLARRLMGLRLAAPVAEGAEVLAADGARLGAVTSAGVLPTAGPVALAFLKAAAAAAGTPVRVGEVAGQVSELPFN